MGAWKEDVWEGELSTAETNPRIGVNWVSIPQKKQNKKRLNKKKERTRLRDGPLLKVNVSFDPLSR